MNHASLGLVLGLLLPAGGARAETTVVDDHKTMTHDCQKDDSLSVAGNHNTVTVTGACRVVIVAGNHNTLVIETTTKLGVSGNHNTVSVTAAETIIVSGNHDTLEWKKGTTAAAPKVSDSGKHNQIAKTK